MYKETNVNRGKIKSEEKIKNKIDEIEILLSTVIDKDSMLKLKIEKNALLWVIGKESEYDD